MPDTLPENQSHLSIRKAADTLNVSLKTLRRWENHGLVHPLRNAQNQRIYSAIEIANLDNRKYKPLPENAIAPQNHLSISQAADEIGVSIKTLRRWDGEGKITPIRDELNRRVFTPEIIETIKTNRPQFSQPSPTAVPLTTPNEPTDTVKMPRKPRELPRFAQFILPATLAPLLSLLPFILITLPILIFSFLGFKPSVPLQSVSFLPTSLQPLAPDSTYPTASSSGTTPSETNPILRRIRSEGEVAGLTVTGGSFLSFENILDDNYNFGVAGTVEGNQVVSTTTVKAPLIINSAEKVVNLNADLLDGHSWEEIESVVIEPNGLQKSYEAGNTITTTDKNLDITLSGSTALAIGGTGAVTFNTSGQTSFTGNVRAGSSLTVIGNLTLNSVPSGSDTRVLTVNSSSGLVSYLDTTNWDKSTADDLSTTTSYAGDVSGLYNALQIGSSVVGSAEITDGSVTESDLAISNAPVNGYVLQTDGSGTLAWVNSSSFGGAYIGLTNQQLHPTNSLWYDFLIGGTSTASATIALQANTGAITSNSLNTDSLYLNSTLVNATATELNLLSGHTNPLLDTASISATVQAYNANTSLIGQTIQESEMDITNPPSNGFVLQTDGSGNLTWVDPITFGGGGGGGFLQMNAEQLYPINTTLDLLIGGDSTAAATIALQATTGNIKASSADISSIRISGTTVGLTSDPDLLSLSSAALTVKGTLTAESSITAPTIGTINNLNISNGAVSNTLSLALQTAGNTWTNSGDLTVSNDLTASHLFTRDTNQSNTLQVRWNEDDTANRILDFYLAGANRQLSLNENFTIGDGAAGILTYTNAATLTVENNASVNQDLTSDAAPTFTGLTLSNLSSLAQDRILTIHPTTGVLSYASIATWDQNIWDDLTFDNFATSAASLLPNWSQNVWNDITFDNLSTAAASLLSTWDMNSTDDVTAASVGATVQAYNANTSFFGASVDESELNIGNGPSAGFVLQTDGSGNLSWADPGGSSTNYWMQTDEQLYAKNANVFDLLIGGDSTAAATIALQANTGNIKLSSINTTISATELGLLDGRSGTLLDTVNAAASLAGWDQNAGNDVTTDMVTTWDMNSTDDVTAASVGATVQAYNADTSFLGQTIDGTEFRLGSDTSGDMTYFNGTDWVRLAGSGTNGFALKYDTNTNTPFWAADIDTNTIYTGSNGISLVTTDFQLDPTYFATWDMNAWNDITTDNIGTQAAALLAGWDQSSADDITTGNFNDYAHTTLAGWSQNKWENLTFTNFATAAADLLAGWDQNAANDITSDLVGTWDMNIWDDLTFDNLSTAAASLLSTWDMNSTDDVTAASVGATVQAYNANTSFFGASVDESELNIGNGPSAGFVLQTDGSGNLSWADPGGSSTNYWMQTDEQLYAKNANVFDLLIGGDSTAAATIALQANTGNIKLSSINTTISATELGLLDGRSGTLLDTVNAAASLAGWDQNAGNDVTTDMVTTWDMNSTDDVTAASVGATVQAYNADTSFLGQTIDGTEFRLGSDTSGDMTYFNGTDWVRLAGSGTNGFALKYDTNTNTPFWAADIDTNTIYTGSNGITLLTNDFQLDPTYFSTWDMNSTDDVTAASVGATVQAYNANTSFFGASVDESELNIGNGPSAGFVLQTDGSGNMTWADPTILTAGSNYWLQTNEQIYAKNALNMDLLIGGDSTAAATIALQANTGNIKLSSINTTISATELGLLDGRSGTLLDTVNAAASLAGWDQSSADDITTGNFNDYAHTTLAGWSQNKWENLTFTNFATAAADLLAGWDQNAANDITSDLVGTWDMNIWDDLTFDNLSTAAASLLSTWDMNSTDDVTAASVGATVQAYNANTSILGSSIEESELTISNGPVAGYVLQTAGDGTLSWTDLGLSASNYWLQTNEQIYAKNALNMDLLIGGDSTAAAKISLQANTGNLIATGNVGIGVPSPTTKLAIQGTNSVATLGSELLTTAADRDFSSSSGNWSGTGWTIGSNVATHVAGANNFIHTLMPSATIGTYYQILATVVTTTTGTIHPEIGGYIWTGNVGQATGTLTQHSWVIYTVDNTSSLRFVPNATWAGTIDDVSVMEITPSNALATIYNSNGTTGIEIRSGGTGLNNTFIGSKAGKSNITGSANTALGESALSKNTTGNWNVALGRSALASNTTGTDNVAIGVSSLLGNTTGGYNTAIGYMSLATNTTGSDNFAFGQEAMLYNKTGSENIGFGSYSLHENTTGNRNTAFGSGSQGSSITANYNTSFGYLTLGSTTGSNNIAFGYRAGDALTTGGTNIIVGYDIDLPTTSSANMLDIGNLVYATGLTSTGTTISTGSVGIGNAAPSYKLDVAGDINTSTGTYRLAGADIGQYFIDSAGTTGQLWGSDGAGKGGWVDTTTWDMNSTDDVTAASIGATIQAYNADTSFLGQTIEESELNIGNGPIPGYVLQTDGSGNMVWVNPSTTAEASNFWLQTGEQLYTKNALNFDLLIGGDSTAAAKIALQANTGNIKLSSINDTISATELSLLDGRSSTLLDVNNLNTQATTLLSTWDMNSTDDVTAASVGATVQAYNANTSILGSSIEESELTISNGPSAGFVLQTDGSGNLSWTDLGLSASNYWLQTNEQIYAKNALNFDLLIGGDSTAAAKIALQANTGNLIATGNVGIGVPSPTTKLAIQGTNSVATLGSELLTTAADRDFSSSSGNWSGTGWTIGSNVATHVAGANNYIHTLTPTAGATYQIKATIVTTTAGTLYPYFGSGWGGTVGKTTGTLTQHAWTITATDTTALQFVPNAAWEGTIDNVTVMEITPSNALATIFNSDGTAGIEMRSGGSALNNAFIGTNAGKVNISGNSNTAVGPNALLRNTTGSWNVAIGKNTLSYNTTGGSNKAIGSQAMLYNTTGTNNLAIGTGTLQYNTTGSENTAIGDDTLNTNVYGSYSVAVGNYALYSATGSRNTAMGVLTLQSLTTGSNNLGLGYNVGDALLTGSNNIVVGYDIDLPTTSSSNMLDIGNLVYATGLTSTGTTISTGSVGIGNAAPSYKLDVAGDINSSTGTYRLAGADIGQYFIDSAGTTGQVWGSDGSGRGGWINTDTWDMNSTDDVTAASVGATVQAYNANTSLLGQTIEESELTISNGPSLGYVLQTAADGTLTWVDPSAFGGANNYWNITNEQISPKNALWHDLMIGGDSTAAATIALQANTGNIKLSSINTTISATELGLLDGRSGTLLDTVNAAASLAGWDQSSADDITTGNFNDYAHTTLAGWSQNKWENLTFTNFATAAASLLSTWDMNSTDDVTAASVGATVQAYNANTSFFGASVDESELNITNGPVNGYVLQTDGDGLMTWAAQSGGVNYFQLTAEQLAPINNSFDILVGGTATGTAKINLQAETGNIALTGTVDGVDLSTYSPYFIGAAGNTGEVWTSDGAGAGAYAAPTVPWSSITAPTTDLTLNMGNYATTINSTATTQNIWNMNANSLTSGNLFSLASTSNALTSGRLLNLDWTPGSPTTSTGDLFRINIGPNGNATNLLNVTNDGTTVFSVSETGITSAVPHAFTAAGDVSMAYDLNFTSQTSSYINSNAPLYIKAGEAYESNNITLQTYNSGNILLDPASGSVGVGTELTPTGKFEVNGAKIGKALVIFNETGDQNILTASASGVVKMTLSNTGNLTLAGNILPSSNDASDIGSDTLRYKDLYLGGETLHLGTSTTDEATISYTTSTNILGISTDATSNGDIAFFTDDLYLDKSTGFVGVGNAAPGQEFDVTGDIQASGDLYLNGSDIRGPTDGVLRAYTDQSFYVDLDHDNDETNNFFSINKDAMGTEILRVQENGNVGIGTNNPTDLVGVVQTTTTGSALDVSRDLAAASTNAPLVNLIQDNAGDDQSVLALQNDGTGTGLTLTSSSTGDLASLTSTGAVTTADGLNISASNGSGVITDAIDVSDPEIVNAINIGANLIEGTNFDVATTGNITVQAGYGLDTNAAGTLNLGITNANAVVLGNTTGATALTLNSGTGAQSFNSSVVSGLTTASAFAFNANALTSGTGMYLDSSSITTGKLLNIDTGTADTLTSGSLLSVTSQMANSTFTGKLANIDWSPDGSTQIYNTGDLLRINLGQYGNIGNLFNVTDNGSTLFSVSETAITSALPQAFTAVGDVSMAYDLVLTNQTASTIESYGPLSIKTGESFESNNLTIKTYNSGNILLDVGANIGMGTTAPESKVQITGGGLCVGSDANCNSDNNTEGTVYAAATAMTVYDIAENYPTKDSSLTYQEIVELDPDNGVFVKRASNSYSGKLLGVISEKPGVLLGGFNGEQFRGELQVAIALSGRVPVKVDPNSPAIKIGDMLTASSTVPGAALKATQAGFVIGKALTDWTPGQSSVMTFVTATYADPTIAFSNTGDILTQKAQVDLLTQTIADLKAESNNLTSQLSIDTATIAAQVVTIEPQIAGITDEVSSISARVAYLESRPTPTPEATPTIEESRIIALETQVASLSASLIDLTLPTTATETALTDSLIASSSSLTTNLTDSLTNDLNLDVESIFVSDFLSVLGDTVLTTATVTNSLTVSSITSLTGNLSIMGDLLTLDTLGNAVTVNGNLNVTGLASLNELTTLSATVSGTLSAPIIDELASRSASLEQLVTSLSAQVASLSAQLASPSATATVSAALTPTPTPRPLSARLSSLGIQP